MIRERFEAVGQAVQGVVSFVSEHKRVATGFGLAALAAGGLTLALHEEVRSAVMAPKQDSPVRTYELQDENVNILLANPCLGTRMYGLGQGVDRRTTFSSGEEVSDYQLDGPLKDGTDKTYTHESQMKRLYGVSGEVLESVRRVTVTPNDGSSTYTIYEAISNSQVTSRQEACDGQPIR